MSSTSDHFSQIGDNYARGRFGYPEALYQFLVHVTPVHDRVWDCATGSGQAAVDLSRHYREVIATDISAKLLSLAPACPGVIYREAPAEQSGLPEASVDLVTVAQALHWFDLPRFWPEASRVLKPAGILAFWGYNWPNTGTEVDAVLLALRAELQPYWPKQSAILHGEYTAVHPPFPEILTPRLSVEAAWTVEDYLAHLRSWSAVRYAKEASGTDPVESYEARFREAWRSPGLGVTWPLIFRVFRKPIA